MEMPKIKIPSAGYVINLIIAMLIIAAIMRFAPIPEGVKSWFRI